MHFLKFVTFLQVCTCSFSLAGFAEQPSPMLLKLGREDKAVFRCRHLSSEAIIGWRVNGSPPGHGQFSIVTPSSVSENSNLVYTLTIPARIEYNGTEVVCLAISLDGPLDLESTPPVALVIRTAYFVVTPSPLNVTVEQHQAVFHCQHCSSDYLTWIVNEQPYGNVATSPISGGGHSSILRLSIQDLLNFNVTTIDCVAGFFDRMPAFQYTGPVILMIQDTPGMVKNPQYQRSCSSNSLTTMWDPLPTLDITNADPDIVYTVELFNITCGQNTLMSRILDVHGVSATMEILDLMQVYKAVIAARNNVREAITGPSVEIEETFMLLSGSTLLELVRRSQVNITSCDPVPIYYTMILESIDEIEGDSTMTITVKRDGEMITMSIDKILPSKLLWRVSILPYGCEEHIARSELSTHDIQDVTASSLHPGQIRVVGDYVDGSAATGVLLILYSLTNDSDVLYIAKQKEQNATIYVSVEGLSGTEYGVSTYALENGLPFPRVVTQPKNVTVALNNDQESSKTRPQPPIKSSLQPGANNSICISCTFIDSTLTDCVAVVHQRISQLSSIGLINIESHNFTRSGDTAYGCIEGVDMDQYQVGVIGVKVIPPTDTKGVGSSIVTVALVVGLVVLLIILGLAAVIIIASVVYWKYKNGCLPNAQPDGQVQAQDDEPASPTGSEGATLQDQHQEDDQTQDQGYSVNVGTTSSGATYTTAKQEGTVDNEIPRDVDVGNQESSNGELQLNSLTTSDSDVANEDSYGDR